jgi:hypothetical protein
VPPRKLIRGAFLIRKHDMGRVRAFLTAWGVELYVRRVALEPEDRDELT